MRYAVVVLLLAVAAIAVLGFVSWDRSTQPTLDDVAAVVDAYFAEDATQKARVRSQLDEWGNLALPHLRALANEPARANWLDRSGLALVCAIGDVQTAEAWDLELAILTGETRVPPARVLGQLFSLDHHPAKREHMLASPAFRPAVMRSLEQGDPNAVRTALRVTVVCGWRDAAPKIVPLLESGDVDLRREVAAALEELTGQSYEVELPKARFPVERLTIALLAPPVRLQGTDGEDPDVISVTPWFDGEPAVLGTFRSWHRDDVPTMQRLTVPVSTGSRAAGPSKAAPLESNRLDRRLLEVEILAREGASPLLVGLSGRFSTADEVVAYDSVFRRVWSYRPPPERVQSMVPLHGPGGVRGVAVAVGGETGVVGLDLQGQETWRVPRNYVVDGLSTHSGLPDHVLAAGGGLYLWRVPENELEVLWGRRPLDLSPYSQAALLFPDEDGEAAVVAIGSTMFGADRGKSVIWRLDSGYKPLWHATVRGHARSLAMIEPPGLPRLFATATDTGDLYICDEDGALRAHAMFPGADAPGAERLLGLRLTGGEVDPGRWGFVCQRFSESYFYEIDLDALR